MIKNRGSFNSFRERQKKPQAGRSAVCFFSERQLFSSFYRCLAEIFHQFAKIESGLASAGASSLVALNQLSLSIFLEESDLSVDSVYEFFHNG